MSYVIKGFRDNLKYYPQKHGGWCIYACAQMLLEFSNVLIISQDTLHCVHTGQHDPSILGSIETFISKVNPLTSNKIIYDGRLDLPVDDIKKYISNDVPVCVNLYLSPPDMKGNQIGHSHIFYGYDDCIKIFYVIDPQPNNMTGNGAYYEMTYDDYHNYDKNRKKGHRREIFIVT